MFSSTTENSEDWILLINDESSQSINLEEVDTITSKTTSKTSEESFNSDDALALKILDGSYDYEAQKPFVLAYSQQDDVCCYNPSSIKQLTVRPIKREVVACVVLVGIWCFLGITIYLITRSISFYYILI